MTRRLLSVWKPVLLLALLISLGQATLAVVSAERLSDDQDPRLVASASPEELALLAAVLQPPLEQSLRELPDSVKETIAQAVRTSMTPEGLPLAGGVSLRSLWFDEETRLVIDLGQEARSLDAPAFEALGDYTIALVNEALSEAGYSSDSMSYYFAIEGVGVEKIFRPDIALGSTGSQAPEGDVVDPDADLPAPEQAPESPAMDDLEGETPPDTGEGISDQEPALESDGALGLAAGISGRRIAINPGHGYYDKDGTWAYSGANIEGVREDNLNVDMAIRLKQALAGVGASVVPLRELERDPSFDSTRKWWQMGTREYARRRLNQPEWVWNYGASNWARDLNARFLLASALNAETLISIHNNSSSWPMWGPEWCGSLVLYDNSNSRRSQSQKLAEAIKTRLDTLKSSYTWWCGAAVWGRNDKEEGENYYSYSPAVVVEVGNLKNGNVRGKLQDAGFQQAAMNRVRDSVSAYYQATPASCPTSFTWRTEYWANSSFGGYASKCQNETDISHNWGRGGPSGLPSDQFSMRAASTQYFAAGNYNFYLGGDDGVRLWIDGVRRIDQWKDQGYTEYRHGTYLSAGYHSLMVEYYEGGGDARVSFRWARVTACTDQAAFVTQSVYPTVQPGQAFQIFFEVRNTGTCTWRQSDNYYLSNINGATLGASSRQELGGDVPPNGTKRWTINMTAPTTPGGYRTQWMIKHGGNSFGPNMFIDVTVAQPGCAVYRAEYFNGRSFSGSPTYTRCENWPIDHNWGLGGPGNGIGVDGFAARWTGRANFAAGSYTFVAGADDGIRVYLDGALIIDGWRDQAYTEYRRTLSVSAGAHDVRIEYYEGGGDARVFFRWDRAVACTDQAAFVTQSVYPTVQPGQGFQIYFEVRNTGTCTWRQSDNYYLSNINGATLGASSRQELGGDVPPNGTKRWTINMTAPTTPAGYRTQWMIKHGSNSFGPNMFIDVTVAQPGCAVYRAEYFNGRSFSGSPTYTRCENWPIDHNWGLGGPGNGIGVDGFATRWTGRANFAAGSYTFVAGADDGIRVYLDGALIIDGWRDQAYTEYRRTLSVSAGAHDVRIEYYEGGGDARVFFRW